MSAQTTTGTTEATSSGTDAGSNVKWMLRVESIGIIAAALAVYAANDFAWWLLPLLLLTPDLSMLGYLIDRRIGAVVYNIGHIYAMPLALGAIGLLSGWDLAFQFSLIWVMHIAVDRQLGYGLKYSDSFRHTHLDHV